jgi:hypothetical protein
MVPLSFTFADVPNGAEILALVVDIQKGRPEFLTTGFKMHGLNTMLQLPEGWSKKIEKAVEDHVLAEDAFIETNRCTANPLERLLLAQPPKLFEKF